MSAIRLRNRPTLSKWGFWPGGSYAALGLGRSASALASCILAVVGAWTAQAAENKSWSVTLPIVQPVRFNGIEARAQFALVPPDVTRPLTQKQLELLADYRALNDACQGGRPGPETTKACDQRDQANLRRSGICYGLKTDKNMAEMEWHSCRVASIQYELGSETISFTCRPGGAFRIAIEVIDLDLLAETWHGEGQIAAEGREFITTYSVVTSNEETPRTSIEYELSSAGAAILLDFYDSKRITFPIGKARISLTLRRSKQALLDEVAKAYSSCK